MLCAVSRAKRAGGVITSIKRDKREKRGRDDREQLFQSEPFSSHAAVKVLDGVNQLDTVEILHNEHVSCAKLVDGLWNSHLYIAEGGNMREDEQTYSTARARSARCFTV